MDELTFELTPELIRLAKGLLTDNDFQHVFDILSKFPDAQPGLWRKSNYLPGGWWRIDE